MRTATNTILLALLLTAQAASSQTRKTLQWIGGPTFVLQLGSFKILTDPMLGPVSDTGFMIKKHPSTGQMNAAIKRLVPPAPFDTSGIDLLLISHLHADHFDGAAKSFLQKQLPAITPASNRDMLVQWGFRNTRGLPWADTAQLVKGADTLRIIAVKARHAAEEPLNSELGEVNGYVLEYRSGRARYRIYWSGDTVWFDDLQSLLQYGRIDLFIPHMGAVGADGHIGRRGLNTDETLQIIRLLQPARIIPVHHTTFTHYVEPVAVLYNAVRKTSFRKKIVAVREGTVISL